MSAIPSLASLRNKNSRIEQTAAPHHSDGQNGRTRRSARTRQGTTCLTERDLAVLCGLLRHRILLRDQIAALYFGGVPTRLVNRRLAKLAAADLLVGGPLPLGPLVLHPRLFSRAYEAAAGAVGAIGSGGQYAYRLGPAAAPIVSAALEIDEAAVRQRIRAGTPTAVAHALQIAQVRIALGQAQTAPLMSNPMSNLSDSEIETLRFFHPEAHHAYAVRAVETASAPTAENKRWKREIWKPDAVFCWSVTAGVRAEESAPDVPERIARAYYFALEVDLGNTGRVEWRKKIAITCRYRASGLFARRFAGGSGNDSGGGSDRAESGGGSGGATGDAARFTTLVLTTSARRIRQTLLPLAEAALAEQGVDPAVNPAPFQFATLTDFFDQPAPLHAPIFLQPGGLRGHGPSGHPAPAPLLEEAHGAGAAGGAPGRGRFGASKTKEPQGVQR